ncbi:MAG: T9SS type A sorting domain-containing protein [Ignavibacteriae bacterium]|nr:T9SS type A sorting domain-containing protein [Ignavibacteriota bacterium]
MAKMCLIVLAALLIVGAAFSGIHKGPRVLPAKATAGDETDEVFEVMGMRVYPTGPLAAPGDSITYTTYDYATNGSVNRNLINYGNGVLSFARMLAQGTGTTPPDRGSWYNFSTDGGRTWQYSWGRVESAYHGWGNIDQLRDFGGLEVIVSHLGAGLPLTVSVDLDRGANSWLPSTTSPGNALWARLGIGPGVSFHIVHGTGGNPATGLGYTRSTDAGLSFDRIDVNIFPGNAVPDADTYAASARGGKIAFVVASDGGDVVLLTSTDNGDTWATRTIYQSTTPPPEPQPQPDGSCDVLIDSAGVIHVAWSNFMRIGADLVYSIDAPVMYWNSSSEVIRTIAYPVRDSTMIVPTNSRFGNYANQPDLGTNSTGSDVYCVFSQLISERDGSNNNYSHVYAVKSQDGGTTWGSEVDLTPGSGFDAAFPTIPDLVEDTVYLAYFADALAGNFIRGNHAQIQVAVMLLRVPVSAITAVHEVGGELPTGYVLQQNYPNPFNPSTRISYSIPTAAQVRLSVYNMLGQEVASLVNEYRNAGTYEKAFSAQDLPSGVYFYTLRAGAFSETRKMILLK